MRCIYVFLFSVTLSHAANNWKSFNREISHEKKIEPTKYPQEKYFDTRNTHKEKFRAHDVTTRKKFWTHEIPMKAG